MRNRISPSTVLTLGLCLAGLAFGLWAVQTTALDPGPLHRGAREVLVEAPVRQSMINKVAVAITLPTGVAVDPDSLALVSAHTVDQPAFIAAFAGALDQIQARVTKGAVVPIALDPTLVTQAARAAAAGDPQLSGALASSDPLVVQIPDEDVPDLARWADIGEAASRAIAFLALLLITYGFLKVEHKVWAIGRVGRWAIVIGIGTLAVFWLLPRVILRPLGGWIGVGGAVLQSGDALVPVALVMIAVGTVTVIAAHRWEIHDRARVLSVIPHATSRSAGGTSTWESPV